MFDAASILLSASSWLVWVGLLIVCAGYALYVRWQRDPEDAGGNTAWLVAGGNILVMLATTLVFALATGTETALIIFFVLFLSNVFGGLPMIFEYSHWHRAEIKKRNRAEQMKRIAGE